MGHSGSKEYSSYSPLSSTDHTDHNFVLERMGEDEEESSEDELFAVNSDKEAVLGGGGGGAGAGAERWYSTLLQICIPFLLAGLGMVAAGLVLDIVQHWPVFVQISEIFILVPALLGLKGNLEMTLASRLSTAANLGKMDTRADCAALVVGNLALIQCQAIVIGFLASLTGVALGYVKNGTVNFQHGLLMCASSVVTASVASFVLGLVMVAVILGSRGCRVNPDNVATPIAASLGDVTTLGLLAWISDLLYGELGAGRHTALVIVLGYCALLPALLYLAYRNPHTAAVLCSGWAPVLAAMLISSGGGMILDRAVTTFRGIAVFSPVMNGAGGNLVAIQASRMTTYLNKATNSLFGVFPPDDDAVCVLPCSALCGGVSSCGGGAGVGAAAANARMARVSVVL